LSMEDRTDFDKFRKRAAMILSHISEGSGGHSAQLLSIDVYPSHMLQSYKDHKEYWEEGRAKIQNLLETVLEEIELFGDRKTENPQKVGKEDQMTMKEKRELFLIKLNEMSEGDSSKFIESMKIGDALGFDRATTFSCARYFDPKGYIKPRDDAYGAISITDKGIDEAERIPLSVVPSIKQSNCVFLVHGHDKEMLESVARTLTELGLKPLILHEQPDQGRYIMQKIEDYSDVRFAVILISPDDEGRLRGAKSALKPRARQNVVLELGYFVGRLGRDRTLVIYREVSSFEFPSDYDKVLYKPFDEFGKWRFELVKELQAAGYSSVSADKLTKK
jgi:predicted nucleotide-binding protein